jgi:hypothetical protein
MPEPVINDSTATMTVPHIKNNDVRIEVFGSEDGRSWSPLKPSGRGPFTFQGKSPGGGPLRIRLEAHRITPWNEP